MQHWIRSNPSAIILKTMQHVYIQKLTSLDTKTRIPVIETLRRKPTQSAHDKRHNDALLNERANTKSVCPHSRPGGFLSGVSPGQSLSPQFLSLRPFTHRKARLAHEGRRMGWEPPLPGPLLHKCVEEREKTGGYALHEPAVHRKVTSKSNF